LGTTDSVKVEMNVQGSFTECRIGISLEIENEREAKITSLLHLEKGLGSRAVLDVRGI